MNGLDKEYSGTVEFEVVDATTAAAKVVVREYGFGTHGMVVFDSTGTPKSRMDGHRMTVDDIRAAIKGAGG